MSEHVDPVVEKVRELLRQRSAIGLVKYGTSLARLDLTRAEWLAHLRDECLDAALYAQRLIDEEAAQSAKEERA